MNNTDKNNRKKHPVIGAILILITGCMWATTGIFSYLFRAYEMPTTQMGFYRVFAAAAVLGLAILVTDRRKFRMTRRGFLVAMMQGLVTQTLFNMVHFKGIELLGMASQVTLLYTAPIYVTIISRLAFGEKITKRKVVAIMIVLVGCALAATGGEFDPSKLSIVGICMGLISGFCNGMVSICAKLGTDTDDSLSLTFYTMLFGFFGLVPIARPWTFTGVAFDFKLVVIVIACALMSVAIPYVLFATGMSMLNEASLGPILSSVEVVAAAAYGYVLFGEPVGVVKSVGIALVLAAIVLINLPGANRQN